MGTKYENALQDIILTWGYEGCELAEKSYIENAINPIDAENEWAVLREAFEKAQWFDWYSKKVGFDISLLFRVNDYIYVLDVSNKRPKGIRKALVTSIEKTSIGDEWVWIINYMVQTKTYQYCGGVNFIDCGKTWAFTKDTLKHELRAYQFTLKDYEEAFINTLAESKIKNGEE